MARNKGLASFSANFEAQIAAPIDARMSIPTKAELYLTATWQANDGLVYVYKGMPVTVHSDSTPDNNGLYILINNDYTQVSSWIKSTGLTGIQGLTGLSLQGVTGILGIDGQTGIEGQQGVTGILGIDGQTGVEGQQGVTGILGIDGQTGIEGQQGVTGILGIDGQTGIEGQTGVEGQQGVTGILGIDGQTGIYGLTGLIGLTGIFGLTGIQGETGFQGVTGVHGLGLTGLSIQGDTGLIGETGFQGLTGFIGDTGLQGFTGIEGLQGVTGLQGLTGLIGDTGIQGLGLTGLVGATGIQGETGLVGDTGIQGLGLTGLIGVTGFQGLTGLISDTGLQGITGLVGNTGIQGLTGLIGDTGFQGITGLIGDTGIQGITGLGDTGIQGITGLIGDTGIQGLQGITGLGDTGIQGYQGDTGIQGYQGETGLVGDTGIQGLQGDPGDVGATGLFGFTGLQGPGVGDQGVTGLFGLDGTTGIQGVTGISFGGGSTGINLATELPLGTPPGGFTPGIFPWDASTKANPAFDNINALLLAIAPAPPGSLPSALVLTGTSKYSAILPTGLDSSWYQNGLVAGSTTSDYIIDNSYSLASGSPSTTFKSGSTFSGDEGTVYHVDDGTNASFRDMTSGIGTSGTITIVDMTTYNSIWRKANARIDYVQSYEGFKRHAMRYQTLSLNQLASDVNFVYDNVNATPAFPYDATVTENTLSTTRYLSGVRYYAVGDSFDMSSIITNIAKKGIRLTNPISYSMPGLNNVNMPISGASFAWDGTYNFAVTDTLDAANVYNINARLSVVATKPSGTTASRTTATENRLVNTYPVTYSTNGTITMFDEGYRWQLSNDFSLIPVNNTNPTGDWVSSSLLTNGNALLYNSTWNYPTLNFTSGYLPGQTANYSSFSGDQVIVYAVYIGLAHSSMRIVFTGVNYTDILPEGTGNLNMSIRLPTKTGWLDCGLPFGVGVGCRNNAGSSGTTLALTFGTNSSSDSNGVVFIRVTLRNTSAAKASQMVITGT